MATPSLEVCIAHHKPDLADVERIVSRLSVPRTIELNNKDRRVLPKILFSAQWWMLVAHSLGKECGGPGDPEEIAMTREEIRDEYFSILKIYWRAWLELKLGRFIPVQYVYFFNVLESYETLTDLVNFLCMLTRTDLQDELDAVT